MIAVSLLSQVFFNNTSLGESQWLSGLTSPQHLKKPPQIRKLKRKKDNELSPILDRSHLGK